MRPRRILIVYGSNHGQTAKIARYMADLLTASGDRVTLARVDEFPRRIVPGRFDGVIVGASVNFSRHQRSVRRFVRANREMLDTMPTAFFSVSGAAAGADEASRAAARGYVDDFLRETGWNPAITDAIAGAMAYTKYPAPTRWMLKRIAQKSGGPTDTSRDHEFTDWAQVQLFVEAFAATVPREAEALALAMR